MPKFGLTKKQLQEHLNSDHSTRIRPETISKLPRRSLDNIHDYEHINENQNVEATRQLIKRKKERIING